MVNLVDEKEGEHFDALIEQLTFTLNMRKDCFADLNAAQLIFADFANNIASIYLDAVHKFYGVIAAIDTFDDKVILIFFHLAGIWVEIEAFIHSLRNFTNTRRTFDVKLNRSGWCSLREVNPFKVHVALGSCRTGFRYTLNGDLFNQTLIICLHSIKAIDHIIDAIAFMGGRIAQGQHWIELLQVLLCLLALDRLRLVDNQNRVRLCNDVNRAAGTEFVQLHVDTTSVLTLGIEGLGIDDHYIDRVVRCETVNLGKLRGVIDEEANLLTILLGKMLLRNLKGLIHALAYSDARDYDNELTPAIVLIELKHCLDVSISFTNAGFHLDCEIIFSLKFRRRRKLVGTLNLLDVFQNDTIVQFRNDLVVAPARKVLFICDALLIVARTAIHHIGRSQIWLSGKHIADSFCCVRLKFLVFEL